MALDRIILIKETMLQTKSACQMFPQCLNTQTLGGMVSGGDKRYAAFLREMEILFGDFPGEIRIHALRYRHFKITLRPAAAPRHFSYAPGMVSDDLRDTLQAVLNLQGKLCKRLCMRRFTEARDVLLAEPAMLHQAQQFAELRVVAKFGMCVQRQVICQQTHVVAQQLRDASFPDAYDGGILVAPEITVMHQDRVRTPCNRVIQHPLRSRHPGGDTLHFRATFHLQSIRAVILEQAGLQQACVIIAQFIEQHLIPYTLKQTSSSYHA